MAEVGAALDLVEQILVRLDVKDLIRFKSVCKSWESLISGTRFVKAHLNHNIKSDCDNHQLGHRRIHTYDGDSRAANLYYYYIVGSCNGLVCVSPKYSQFLVTNPCTREEKKLQTLRNRFSKDEVRRLISWGFGYDSSSDDYKVVAGFREGRFSDLTVFHVLTLKSNTWKFIGKLNYVMMACSSKTGVLCDGVLYWLMTNVNEKVVIISLRLSTEEFKEIPQPDDADYNKSKYFKHKLGILQDCLCIYSYSSLASFKIRVMINNKWEELYVDQQQISKYDVAHCLNIVDDDDSQNKRGYVYGFSHYDGHHVPCNGDYVCSSLFVKSLVSPHPQPPNKEGKEDNEGV